MGNLDNVEVVISHKGKKPVLVALVRLASLPRRGEVLAVVQDDPGANSQDAAGHTQTVHYLVEQTVTVAYNEQDLSFGQRPQEPLPRQRLYVSLLDEEGQPCFYERGPIPGRIGPETVEALEQQMAALDKLCQDDATADRETASPVTDESQARELMAGTIWDHPPRPDMPRAEANSLPG